MFSNVRKEMPGLTESAYRREAARRMGTDYDTYLKAWKKPGSAQMLPKPQAVIPKKPQPWNRDAPSVQMTAAERESFGKYTFGTTDPSGIPDDNEDMWYTLINSALRHNQSLPNGSTSIIRNMDVAIGRSVLPEEVHVYRGVDFTFDSRGEARFLQQLQPGGSIVDNGYMSTSLDREATEFFGELEGGSILFDITVPAGTGKGVILGKGFNEDFGGFEQSEVILARGTKLRITDVKKVGLGWLVKAIVM